MPFICWTWPLTPCAGFFEFSGWWGLVGYWSRCQSSTFWWVVWPLPSRPFSLAPSCSPLWSSSGPLCLEIAFGMGQFSWRNTGVDHTRISYGFMVGSMFHVIFLRSTGSANFWWLLWYGKYQVSDSEIFPKFRSLRHQAPVSCCLDGPWNWFPDSGFCRLPRINYTPNSV